MAWCVFPNRATGQLLDSVGLAISKEREEVDSVTSVSREPNIW